MTFDIDADKFIRKVIADALVAHSYCELSYLDKQGKKKIVQFTFTSTENLSNFAEFLKQLHGSIYKTITKELLAEGWRKPAK